MTKFNELLRGEALIAEAHLQEGVTEPELRAAVCNALTRVHYLEQRFANMLPSPDTGKPKRKKESEALKLFKQLRRSNESLLNALNRHYHATGLKARQKTTQQARFHRAAYEDTCVKLFELLSREST